MLYQRSTWRDALTLDLLRWVFLALIALFAFAIVGGYLQTRVQHRAWDQLTSSDSQYINNLRYSPDFRLIATASLSEGVYVWNASDKTLLNKLGEEGIGTQLEFSPGSPDFGWTYQDYAYFYSRNEGRMVYTPIKAKSWLYALAISPDQYAIVATGGTAVELWNTVLPDHVHHIADDFNNKASVYALAFSDDTSLLAAGIDDGRVITWRVDASKPTEEIKTEQVFARSVYSDSDSAHLLVFSPDKHVLAAGRDNNVALLRAQDGETLRDLQAPGFIYRFAFSPDSKLLVVAHSDTIERSFNTQAPTTITAWRVDTGERTWTSERLPSPIADLRISPGNKTITTGHYDGEVRTHKMP